jgi:hypothetical protein
MFKNYFSEKYECPNCNIKISKQEKLQLMYKKTISCPFCEKNIGISKSLFRPLLPFELGFVVLFYFFSNASETQNVIVLLIFFLLSLTLGTKIDTLASRIVLFESK